MINYDQLQKISKDYGDSFYIFDTDQLKENIELFKNSFTQHYPKVEVAYSYKTNYIPAVLRIIDSLKISPEVVSEMEVAAVQAIEGSLHETGTSSIASAGMLIAVVSFDLSE